MSVTAVLRINDVKSPVLASGLKHLAVLCSHGGINVYEPRPGRVAACSSPV